MNKINDEDYLASYFITNSVPFKFRGINFTFDLSHGLFSSADVDSGTRFLLKVFSQMLDKDTAAGKPLPRHVLDAGCGCGIIGICAAAALGDGVSVRCQDRDELARLVTLRNAAKNRIPPASLAAFTEPLLAVSGEPSSPSWDLIFSNIPAKAGAPVLEDFVRRSAGLLNPGGRVMIVVVNTLADFFREQIAGGIELVLEERGPGHSVFVYSAANLPATEAIGAGPLFLKRYPFYIRAAAVCKIEEISVKLETVYGAPGFDRPGGAVSAAVKLLRRLSLSACSPILIHEGGQGFFPRFLIEFFRESGLPIPPLVFSGRNILALEAAKYNTGVENIVPAADLNLGREVLREASCGGQYGAVIVFPELLPQSALPKIGGKGRQKQDQLTALWDALPPLLSAGGLFLAAFGSSQAERFDRKKPSGFTRLGSLKRDGFRALAYQR